MCIRDRVDVVGVNERYPQFVSRLQARFGWWPTGVDTGARVNVSGDAPDADPPLRRRIAHDNAFDVELYDLAKDLSV